MRRTLGVYTALLIVVLYLPIAMMILFSFNSGEQIVVWKGFSLKWYQRALENEAARTAFGQTLVIGLGSTLLATFLGTCAAIASVRLTFPGKRAFNLLLSVPITIPDILMGVSLFAAFMMSGLGLGVGAVIAAHATFSFAYVAVVVGARLQAVDPSLELAAQDLGATPFGAFARVTLRAILPAILSGAVLAFAMSFDDVVITYFTGSERVNTLPVHLYSKVRYKFTPEVNALSTLMLVASAALVAIAIRLHRPPLNGGKR